MRATTKTRTTQQVDAGYEASRIALNAGMGMAALIGIWGVACLIGGLATSGAGGMLKGFLTAVTGC